MRSSVPIISKSFIDLKSALPLNMPISIQIEPTKKLAEFQLRLMTIRSEGQFNTVVYEEEDVYRNQTQRDIIMMNEQDMKDMHLAPEERVNVVGVNGSLFVTVRPYQITTGNCAMYFPEANILLSTEVDAESKTPLFKGAIVELLRCVDA